MTDQFPRSGEPGAYAAADEPAWRDLGPHPDPAVFDELVGRVHSTATDGVAREVRWLLHHGFWLYAPPRAGSPVAPGVAGMVVQVLFWIAAESEDLASFRALELLASVAAGPHRELLQDTADLRTLLAAAAAERAPAASLRDDPLLPPHASRPARFGLYEAVLTGACAAALPVAREILLRPVLPALGGLADDGRWLSFGAKPLALGVLAQHAVATDAGLLRRLVLAPREPFWTRVNAAVSWHAVVGSASLEPVVSLLLYPALRDPSLFDGGALRLADIGADLVPALVGALHDARDDVRLRAWATLSRIDPPPIEALAEVVRETADPRLLDRATVLLNTLSPAALEEALRSRKELSRAISLVADPPAAERGISPSEAPDA